MPRPTIKSNVSVVSEEPPKTDDGLSQHTLDSYKKYEKYRSLVVINKDTLDECVQRQPELYQDVGEEHSIILSMRDSTAENLKKVDAEIAAEVRQSAEERGAKVTNDFVNDSVILHPRRKKLKNEYEQLAALANKWAALKASYEQRMRMLRELVQLYTVGYWTDSTNTSSRSGVRDAGAADARSRMNAERQRRGGNLDN